ncbi:uncharacterized protein LOC141527884 isoform X1 [Cotesia typhae]|uniref:uncharacterized protein LOC141527884 isoform X1 n=2 Tax=Cotesia typhae TaxID=2053667 RepID=UPI003D68F14F
MLKFLTHKLRTHSINEDPNHEKVDDDHDSGTESDDEFQDGIDESIEPSSLMASPSSPGLTDSAVPSDTDFCPNLSAFAFGTSAPEDQRAEGRTSLSDNNLHLSYNDHHSSEEELEVINSPKVVASQGLRPATAPEKRKWSQVNNSNSLQSHCTQSQAIPGSGRPGPTPGLSNDSNAAASCSAPVSRAGKEPGSGSSDEEVQGLLGANVISQPVQFRSSPPVDAHKPGRSQSPPPKLFHAAKAPPRPRSRPRHHHLYHHHHHHYQHQHQHHHYQQQYSVEMDVGELSACSPRKRHRPPHRQPRPCLDFEKMQQLKARAVTAWRHSGDHGSELSVFCW